MLPALTVELPELSDELLEKSDGFESSSGLSMPAEPGSSAKCCSFVNAVPILGLAPCSLSAESEPESTVCRRAGARSVETAADIELC